MKLPFAKRRPRRVAMRQPAGSRLGAARRLSVFAAVILLLATTVSLAIACTPKTASQAPPTPALPEEVPPEFAKIWEVYRTLRQDYVDKDSLDPGKLADGAVKGMIGSLNDPFTAYFDSKHFGAAVNDLEGSFEGIGAVVSIKSSRATVVSVMSNTPAQKTGLRAGDIIAAVDGVSTENMTLDEVVNRIRGPHGTSVHVRIDRASSKTPLEYDITRAKIQVTTVSTETLSDGIARLEISQFTRQTTGEVDRALKDLRKRNVKGIVLDLRNNPGGYLNVVVDVASQFLKDGLVLYEIDAKGERKDWPVSRGGLATEVPLVVLVNKGSASGSEVVAGALQSHKRAPLIGTETFGKGGVNITRGLSDGSGLYMTIARWHTPSGEQIGGKGLTPDIRVEMTDADIQADRDPQLDRALEKIKDQMGQKVPATVAG